MYACPNCGLVHEGTTIEKKRVDRKGAGPGPGGFRISEFHGYEYYRVCPECNYKHHYNTISD